MQRMSAGALCPRFYLRRMHARKQAIASFKLQSDATAHNFSTDAAIRLVYRESAA
jgi:hypothetical protein